MVRRGGGRVSKSQPVINRRTFPPLNRRSVNDLVTNWPNLVNTANPQACVSHPLPHGRQQEVTLPPDQLEAQPDHLARQAAGQAQGGGEMQHEQELPTQPEVGPAEHHHQPIAEQVRPMEEGDQVDLADLQVTRGLQQDLSAWINPTLPQVARAGDIPPAEDADGWSQIGMWECGLYQLKTLEEAPPAFRVK